MKRITIILALVLACASAAMAQKFALVDMDYILKNVPQYEMANEQLNQLSQRWQKEVEAVGISGRESLSHRRAGEEARGRRGGKRERGH